MQTLQAMRRRGTLPGLKQEQLKHNTPHCFTLPGVLSTSPYFKKGFSFISRDANFCKEKEKDQLIVDK